MAWNRPTSNTVDATSSSRPTGRGKMPCLRKGLLAGAIVVLGAGLAAWFLMSGEADSRPLQKKERGRIKEAKSAVTPKVEALTVETNKVETAKETEKPGRKLIEVQTNGDYVIEISIDSTGRKCQYIREKPSPWKYSTDGILATALQNANRPSLPPWPNLGVGLDKEFRKSLSDPIVVLETDDDKTAALKRIVTSARAEMKERLDAGEHFCDVMNDFRELTNENGKIRTDAILELNKIRASGDEEGAHKYEVVMNAAFSQMGIEPIGEGSAEDKALTTHSRKIKRNNQINNPKEKAHE